jgi:hypothetical protein
MVTSLSASDLPSPQGPGDGPPVRAIARELESALDGLAGDEGSAQFQRAVASILTQAVRLYTGHCQEPYAPETLAAVDVTQTEACTVAAALLHSQSLSPFEFAVWFSSRT